MAELLENVPDNDKSKVSYCIENSPTEIYVPHCNDKEFCCLFSPKFYDSFVHPHTSLNKEKNGSIKDKKDRYFLVPGTKPFIHDRHGPQYSLQPPGSKLWNIRNPFFRGNVPNIRRTLGLSLTIKLLMVNDDCYLILL